MYAHNLFDINAFQLFLKNPKQKGKINFTERGCLNSKNYIEENSLFLVCHSPYVINIASSDESIIHENLEYVVNEIDIISKHGGKGSVYHVGKSVKLNKSDGFANMSNFIKMVLNELIERDIEGYFILETGAGCGTELCTKIENLGEMYHTLSAEQKEKIMFCIDTCHIFSAGYPINTIKGAEDFINLFEESIGWHKVICIHLNDSKTECGSCVDRHDNFTKGHITNEQTDGIRYFLKHVNNLMIPLILETPYEDNNIIENRINEINLIKSWII
jgi:deoxyribonuclease-4